MSRWRADKVYFILLFAAVGCFALSFIAMGLAPWTTLKHVHAIANTSGNPYYDDSGKDTSIGRGRKIYIKEACWHCHSQFVRPVAGEPYRYGPASQAWESRFDIPQTFGTRRVGPDLSREAGRRSDQWHFAHLYNPRWTTPLSVMPGYPWYFEKDEKGQIVPTQEAQDLVAYLQYLGKDYEEQIRDIVYPKLYKVSGSPRQDSVNREKGLVLFRENCIGCHGEKALGNGPAAQFMQPVPANLVDRYIAASEAYSILARGVLGSAMPSFREMPERDLWAIALFVSELGENTKQSGLSEAKHTASVVAKGKGLFEGACVSCHGKQGSGDGLAADALNPRPKDFSRRLFNPDYFRSILQNGVPGSAMPPFPLPDDQIEAIHAYVTSLYRKEL